MTDAAEVETVEIRLLLEGIQQVYGYDFRDYADASLSKLPGADSAGHGSLRADARQLLPVRCL